jgi:hypothetical protein
MIRMKTAFAIILLGIVGAASLVDAQSTPEAWVRQTDLQTGLIYDMPQSGTGGSYLAPLPVADAGARFELFARGTAWDTNIYLLDTKIVRAYSPSNSMTVTTEDDYIRGDASSGNYVKRTRADRPITLHAHVSGLVPGSAVLAEQAVYLGIKARNYDPEVYSAIDQPQYTLHEYNLGNGDFTLGPIYHELTSGSLSAGCGEQTYTCIRYASDGVPDTILGEPKVEIWPIATAAADKIVEGQVFNDRIPIVSLTLKHLYPDSRTYVQVYPGVAELGKAGTVITGTERTYGRYYNPTQVEEPTNVPQDVSLSVEDLSNYASADGIYTMEVITETPFYSRAPERLLHITFEVDRVISSRGQLSSSEKQVATPPPVTPP